MASAKSLLYIDIFHWLSNVLLSWPQKGWFWRQRCYLVRYPGLNNWFCCIRLPCLPVTSRLSFHHYRVSMDKIQAWFVSDATPRYRDYAGERQLRVGSDCEWRYIRVASLPWLLWWRVKVRHWLIIIWIDVAISGDRNVIKKEAGEITQNLQKIQRLCNVKHQSDRPTLHIPWNVTKE
jgi:hypothetical protein